MEVKFRYTLRYVFLKRQLNLPLILPYSFENASNLEIRVFSIFVIHTPSEISEHFEEYQLVKVRNHGKLENTYYNKEELNINRLRQIYNCTYSMQKIRWFLIKAYEELDMLEDSIKIL
uniref:Uncharacterized protein n=1 Tax=Physcomitrium patens TaxID=3218 RepID=A0A7I4AEJ9_PHYPA